MDEGNGRAQYKLVFAFSSADEDGKDMSIIEIATY